MTNGDKMRELVGSDSTDEQIVGWGYMNRICVSDLPLEPEFAEMSAAVAEFEKSPDNGTDEEKNFELFLKREWREPNDTQTI